MPSFATNLRLIATTFEMTLKRNATDAFMWFGIIVQPMLIALLALWMLDSDDPTQIIYVVIGSAMTGLWSTLLFESGNAITGERWTGTLESLVAAPASLAIGTFGKTLAHVSLSLVSMICCYALAAVTLGTFPVIKHPLLFALSLLFTVVGFVGFSLILAPLFMINPDVKRWQNGLEFPVFILCGFLFPITLLPTWTTPLSYMFSMHWAARALHNTSSGTGDVADLLLSWGLILLLTLFYVAISSVMFRRIEYKARVEATLGLQ